MKKDNNEVLLQRVSDHYEVKEHNIKTEEESLVGEYKSFDKAYDEACVYQERIKPRYGLRIVVA